MRILGLITARGGSKGIPNKNIKLLGGKPLIVYTIEKMTASKLLTERIVSTDSEAILSVAAAHGIQSPFVRPEHLALDTTPSIAVVQHAIAFYQKQGISFDAVCLLQPTVPFRGDEDIDQAIATFIKNKADSLISVSKVPHQYNPHWVFEVNPSTGYLKIATGEKEIIPRRQELPDGFIRDGSIYITKTDVIMKQNSLYGENISYIVSSSPYHVNIDTMEDWEQAEKIVTNLK